MERYNREILKVFDNKQFEELLEKFLIEDEKGQKFGGLHQRLTYQAWLCAPGSSRHHGRP